MRTGWIFAACILVEVVVLALDVAAGSPWWPIPLGCLALVAGIWRRTVVMDRRDRAWMAALNVEFARRHMDRWDAR